MTDNETQICALIERWADAVHAGDLDGVLADHSADIVMFDVPLPKDGVRGIDAYRETWPPFFEWQRRGATFEIVSLEVTAGDASRSRTPCFAAGPPKSTSAIRTIVCASRSGSGRRTAAGSSRTSTTPSRRRRPIVRSERERLSVTPIRGRG
jgi:ketosteroid isomerase-like protein